MVVMEKEWRVSSGSEDRASRGSRGDKERGCMTS